jgi:hypothetical protein
MYWLLTMHTRLRSVTTVRDGDERDAPSAAAFDDEAAGAPGG